MQSLDVGQTLERAFQIYTGHFKDLFIVSLIVSLASAVITFISLAAFSSVVIVALAVMFFILIFATLFSIGASYGIASAAYEGRTVSWQESFQGAVGKLGPLFVTGLLAALAVLAGLILCVLPGIWIGVALFAAIPVVMVEGQSGVAALSRSFELVQGRWWATFGRLILGGLLVGVVTSIINAVTGGNDPSVVGLLVRTVATAAVSPFTVALVVVVYFDLRARREGGGGQAFPPAPAGFPEAPAGPVPPSTSVPPPGGDWSAPQPAAPPIPPPAAPPVPPPAAAPPVPPPAAPPVPPPAAAPPVPPPAAPPAPPADPAGGTSASTGSLWSAGDPLAQPPSPPEEQWAPPSSEDEGTPPPPSAPPPA